MLIVFLGVDGSGKTTLIDLTKEWINRNNPSKPLSYFHFCPTSRYNKTGNAKVTNPHERPPYGILKNVIKDMYFLWNFYRGNKIAKKLVQSGNVVVVDRYYYDILIDPLRYRMVNLGYRKLLMKLVPKPDLVFYCVGDSKIIFNRKKETSIENIDSQQSNIFMLKSMMHCEKSKWIEVNTTINSIDSSLSIIKDHILK